MKTSILLYCKHTAKLLSGNLILQRKMFFMDRTPELNMFSTIMLISGMVCFLMSAIPAAESSNDSTVQELKKVVVTATKRSRSVSDIPVSATIISKEDIMLSEAKNVDDLIQYATGVQVKRAVGMGEGVPSDIIMRGIPGALAATRTLILVDGIPTNLSGTPFLILNEIPLEAVKRIEIIRGPFSSIYGANAFGGVINILTETGDGRPNVKLTGETSFPFTSIHNYNRENRQTGTRFWGENTQLSYWNVSALTGAGNEKADILAAGGYRTIGNYILKDSALIRRASVPRQKDPSNHDYTDYRLLLKSGWRITDQLKNTLHLRLFKSELGFGKTGTVPNDDVVVEGQKLLIGDFLEVSPRANLHLKAGGFFRIVDGDYADRADSVTLVGDKYEKRGIVPTIWDARSRDIQGEGSVVFIPAAAHTIIGGFDILHNNIHFGALKYRSTEEVRAGESDVDMHFWNSGIYAQDDIRFMGFNIIPALRFDYHSKFGPMFSPKLGLSKRFVGQLTLRSSAGTAFRAPSTTELYGNVITSAAKVKGNPELKPERVFAVDGGFEVDAIPGMSVVSNAFYNKMTNLIALSFDETAIGMALENQLVTVTHGNVSNALSWGVENEVSIKKFKPFNASLSYTFTQSKNKESKKTLDYIPAHKASATIGYTKKVGNGSLHIVINELFVGSRNYLDYTTQPTPVFRFEGVQYIYKYVTLRSYWKTDFSLSYTFSNNHTLLLTVQNLFDADIEESGGTYSPGRFFSIKYSALFSL